MEISVEGTKKKILILFNFIEGNLQVFLRTISPSYLTFFFGTCKNNGAWNMQRAIPNQKIPTMLQMLLQVNEDFIPSTGIPHIPYHPTVF